MKAFCTERTKKIITVNWRCAKAGCKGCLATILQCRQQQHPPASNGVQMHPPNPAEMAIQRMENTVKTAAVTTRDPQRRIVQDATTHVNEEIAAAAGSSTNLRQTIRWKRRATDNNPPAPGTVGELLLPDQVKDFCWNAR